MSVYEEGLYHGQSMDGGSLFLELKSPVNLVTLTGIVGKRKCTGPSTQGVPVAVYGSTILRPQDAFALPPRDYF
jgi:hypothetical protein